MLIKKPSNFNYKSTIYSHGWYQLAPFEFDESKWQFKYVFQANDGKEPISAKVKESGKKLKIEVSTDKTSKNNKNKIINDVKRILRFDENLDEFYKLIADEKDFQWIIKAGVGRLFRSPTVFEDLVKTICTTNCSWALTKSMVNNLVEKLGESNSFGDKSFPAPKAMAEVDEEFYRKEIRSGYRSGYFVELADSVTNKELNPEDWLNSNLPTPELKKEMKKIKGVGDYAAENLLKLVGRYDGLALDSFLRSEFYKKHNENKPCSDKKIRSFYERFGKWQGLLIWFDMSKRWLDEQENN